MGLKQGDLVWIVPDASFLVRNESIATKAVLVREIPDGWWRVHMSWLDKTRMVDLPAHMLQEIKKNEDR